MKVYATLVVFHKKDVDGFVITDSNGCLPCWEVNDFTKESMFLAKEGFEVITGIKDWPIPIEQAGTFEFLDNCGDREVFISYASYLEDHQPIKSSYKWASLKDTHWFDENSLLIIRYIKSHAVILGRG